MSANFASSANDNDGTGIRFHRVDAFQSNILMTPIALDGYVASDEQLSKLGRVGKIVAQHRVASIYLAFTLMVIGFLAVLWLGGNFFVGQLRPVAPGVSYRFGADTVEFCQTVLPNNVVVERNFEPLAVLSNVNNALLLLKELQHYEPVVPSDIERGYMAWRVSESEAHYNYTLSAARKLAQRVAKTLNLSCVCYPYLGLSTNAIYLSTPTFDEVIYEPLVVRDEIDGNAVAYTAPTQYELIAQARALIRKNALLASGRSQLPEITLPPTHEESLEPWKDAKFRQLSESERQQAQVELNRAKLPNFRLPHSGKLKYITEAAQFRHRIFNAPHYQCIKSCLFIFAESGIRIHSE